MAAIGGVRTQRAPRPVDAQLIAMQHDARSDSPDEHRPLALEELDETLRRRADRSKLRARLGLSVVVVGLAAALLALVLPGDPNAGPGARIGAVAPGLVGALIGGVVAVGARGRFARYDGLRRAGVMGRGRVRSLERAAGGWRVSFEFQDGRGLLHRATSESVSGAEAHRWAVGAVGLLLYDPRAPSDALWLDVRAPSSGS